MPYLIVINFIIFFFNPTDRKTMKLFVSLLLLAVVAVIAVDADRRPYLPRPTPPRPIYSVS